VMCDSFMGIDNSDNLDDISLFGLNSQNNANININTTITNAITSGAKRARVEDGPVQS